MNKIKTKKFLEYQFYRKPMNRLKNWNEYAGSFQFECMKFSGYFLKTKIS